MKKSNESMCSFLEVLLNRMLQAEEDILKQLKVVSGIACSGVLKTIYDDHIAETKQQVERLKDCIKLMVACKPKEDEGIVEKGKKTLKSIGHAAFHQKSEAIHGIIKEGEQVFKDYVNTNLHDYVLASGSQSLEMGEVSSYKTLISLAKECGFTEIQELLEVTLKEEVNAYNLLRAFTEEEGKKAQKSA